MTLPPADVAVATMTAFGLKLLGAIAIWVIGRRLIVLAVSLTMSAVRRQSIDETLVTYLGSGLSILLDVILVVAILGFFGVETTSFAALLAGIGIAIGAAWGGILSNLAAGVFLVGLRPFRVGDFVTAGGITGTIAEIGLLATVINTPDNIRTIVGNGKILGDVIQNIGFTAAGPQLAVRPFCHNDHSWQVYFDTNRAIRDTFAAAGYPAPEQLVFMRSQAS